MAINLGVDPKHADQIVRGTVSLPNGIGKDIRIWFLLKMIWQMTLRKQVQIM